jgi:hypothetical protein
MKLSSLILISAVVYSFSACTKGNQTANSDQVSLTSEKPSAVSASSKSTANTSVSNTTVSKNMLTTTDANANSSRHSLAEDRPEIGEYAEVYQDKNNLRVTIIRFGPRERKEALVEINGIDHPWNKQIFRVSVSDWTNPSDSSNKKVDYVTQVNGEDWYLLNRRGNRLQLNLRENGDAGKEQNYDLSYSAELSKNSKPEDLLTTYLEQKDKNKESKSR